jgi:hypothetical protein
MNAISADVEDRLQRRPEVSGPPYRPSEALSLLGVHAVIVGSESARGNGTADVLWPSPW